MEMYGLECPCRECQERYAGCGAKCDVYKLWKKAWDEKQAAIREAKNRDDHIKSYQTEQKRKAKRRRDGKDIGKRRK